MQTSTLSVYPMPGGGFVLTEDTWSFDARGDRDWRSDTLSHHDTREQAEAARSAIVAAYATAASVRVRIDHAEAA
jgi:hypothetical protein